MKLADWLTAHDVSTQTFADRIGKSQAAVSRYASDKRMPEHETLIKIYEETAGEVSPNDFVALPVLGQGDDADDAVDEAAEAAVTDEPRVA